MGLIGAPPNIGRTGSTVVPQGEEGGEARGCQDDVEGADVSLLRRALAVNIGKNAGLDTEGMTR